MTALDRWLLDHRAQPWPDDDPVPAPAAALHERYAADMKAQDRATLNHRDFGVALRDAGYQPTRIEGGNVYAGLTVESRQERAEMAVIPTFYGWGLQEAEDEATGAHRERMHADGSKCDHPTPESVRATFEDHADAYVEGCREDGSLAHASRVRFFYYLAEPFNRPGQPNPRLVLQAMALRPQLQTLLRLLAKLRFEVERLEAVAPAPKPERPADEPEHTGTSLLAQMADGIMNPTPYERAVRDWHAGETARTGAIANAQAELKVVEWQAGSVRARLDHVESLIAGEPAETAVSSRFDHVEVPGQVEEW